MTSGYWYSRRFVYGTSIPVWHRRSYAFLYCWSKCQNVKNTYTYTNYFIHTESTITTIYKNSILYFKNENNLFLTVKLFEHRLFYLIPLAVHKFLLDIHNKTLYEKLSRTWDEFFKNMGYLTINCYECLKYR